MLLIYVMSSHFLLWFLFFRVWVLSSVHACFRLSLFSCSVSFSWWVLLAVYLFLYNGIHLFSVLFSLWVLTSDHSCFVMTFVLFYMLLSKWVYLIIHVSCIEIVLLFAFLSVWALSADYSCVMLWHLICCYSLVGKCFFNFIFQVLILCAHQLVSALQYLVTNDPCPDLFWIFYHSECELSQIIMYFITWQTFQNVCAFQRLCVLLFISSFCAF